ncbi:methionine--tRNA ligase [Alkaliphilus hydrothermalis]|uniref:Methionine--tRNA ligase n=1 Tax=Alkaliphilus hydrothermalis TaxID=1482730 RepID=A0ABS2NPG2_9FIRM|nr:methionine--tRNA ligase [Alkaliphilus hydrothermalis]MBM7614751.1 methionyl-tRNA synthetase [Alkaliphilus hydrothermalis]
MSKEKYYITTAIAYTSGKPHIGNTYEVILADAIARFKRQQGYDVFFMTGTDEHGEKIETKAREAGKTPKEFVDEVAGEIKSIFDLMNTKYDKFIRTTDEDHEKQVQKIFKKLYDQGDIYKGHYEGKYCTPCESFWTESQLVDGNCPDCGRPVVEAKEEAYFLKLSKYQDRLMKHIEENPEFIQPESRKNEMINNFLKPGLQDLCVSRTSFKWGIPVTFDEKHVIYVWIDALSNYITGIGYDVDGNHGEKYNHYWPADLHLIGKDILRFHTLYWPIILMALDIPLPKQIFGHPWMLPGGDGKMSKSKGNTIYADDLARHFGVDGVRYYSLHEMPFAQDGTITWELVIERVNSDLVNVLGNLVNRTITMVNKYFDGVVEAPIHKDPLDDELIKLALETPKKVVAKMDQLKVSDAISEIFTLLRRSNKYIDETTPWILGKDPEQKDRLATVLYNLLESIRVSAVLLHPFLPQTAEEMLKQLNTSENSWESLAEFNGTIVGTKLEKPEIIFNRIDAAKKLEEIKEELEKNQPKEVEEKKVKPVALIKEEITIDDFSKLDLRAVKVIKADKHPKADRLLVLQVQLGDEVRQVVSGIAAHYSPDDMVGKTVILVANLKPVKLRGVESQGMILAASNDEKLVLGTLDGDMDSGTPIS